MNSPKDIPLILIVDDNPINLQVLGNILLNSNFEVAAESSGLDALKFLEKKLPDLILLDIMMPGMDGYEVCEKLKSNPVTKKIPIIFITALNETVDETKGLNVGAVDYITKPISEPILLARVETHLALYDQNRILEQKVDERTKELNEKNIELEETRLEIVQRLGRAAEYKDNETGLHIIRMSRMSEALAKEIGLDMELQQLILNASPMHDIGKIGIPDNVLLKPGKLDKEEWEIMKTHVTIGASILDGHPSSILKLAKDIAMTHHEKWNGSGYPKGLQKEEIPITGRIVAVSDVFDALTSERPYKKAWSVDDSVQEIVKNKGKHFDPEIVDAFERILPSFVDIKNKYKEPQSIVLSI